MVKNKIDHIPSIKKMLAPYNPWWESGEVKAEPFKRPVFHKIYKDLLSLKQIISITRPAESAKPLF